MSELLRSTCNPVVASIRRLTRYLVHSTVYAQHAVISAVQLSSISSSLHASKLELIDDSCTAEITAC